MPSKRETVLGVGDDQPGIAVTNEGVGLPVHLPLGTGADAPRFRDPAAGSEVI